MVGVGWRTCQARGGAGRGRATAKRNGPGILGPYGSTRVLLTPQWQSRTLVSEVEARLAPAGAGGVNRLDTNGKWLALPEAGMIRCPGTQTLTNYRETYNEKQVASGDGAGHVGAG